MRISDWSSDVCSSDLTETLRPLHPLYVSTVDSGNLTGHLLTLRQGLLAQAAALVLATSTWQGLRDTLPLLEVAGGATPAAFRPRIAAPPGRDRKSRA